MYMSQTGTCRDDNHASAGLRSLLRQSVSCCYWVLNIHMLYLPRVVLPIWRLDPGGNHIDGLLQVRSQRFVLVMVPSQERGRRSGRDVGTKRIRGEV